MTIFLAKQGYIPPESTVIATIDVKGFGFKVCYDRSEDTGRVYGLFCYRTDIILWSARAGFVSEDQVPRLDCTLEEAHQLGAWLVTAFYKEIYLVEPLVSQAMKLGDVFVDAEDVEGAEAIQSRAYRTISVDLFGVEPDAVNAASAFIAQIEDAEEQRLEPFKRWVESLDFGDDEDDPE